MYSAELLFGGGPSGKSLDGVAVHEDRAAWENNKTDKMQKIRGRVELIGEACQPLDTITSQDLNVSSFENSVRRSAQKR